MGLSAIHVYMALREHDRDKWTEEAIIFILSERPQKLSSRKRITVDLWTMQGLGEPTIHKVENPVDNLNGHSAYAIPNHR